MKKSLSVLFVLCMVLALFSGCGTADTGSQKAKVIDIALSEEYYAYCVNQENAELLGKVNEYLAQIQADGTFAEICDHYFGTGTPAEVVSATRDDSKDQLIVATATGFAPFEMVSAGVYSGIDLEIADGLAKYLGKELVIEDMVFASVVTSVQQGICDIGMAGLTVTPARQEVVTFSDSYYSANQMLIVPGDNTEFDACVTAEDVVAILNQKNTSTDIGYQTGTTGGIYITGDADDPDGYGFPGLPVTPKGYDYAALAVTAMINGEVDYVIVDDAPAKTITAAVNAAN